MTESTNPACLQPHPDDTSRLIADIPSPCVQNHAANLMPLPNGDIACVWFGGSQEGKSDISIYFSRLPAGAACWSEAVQLSDDATRSEQNPVLFPAPDGTLWLFYTAQKSGNQDTSIIRSGSPSSDPMIATSAARISTPGTRGRAMRSARRARSPFSACAFSTRSTIVVSELSVPAAVVSTSSAPALLIAPAETA